jgi:hypothetical protein
MYKKISSYVVLVIFFAVCGSIFGMEEDHALRESVRKGIIPSLSVNDYIVPVSSAYQALLKEASFKQHMLRNMINTVNTRLRQQLAGRGGVVYQLFDEKMVERFVDPNFYLRIPCYRYMELTYNNAEKSECSDDMDAQVKVFTFAYSISPITFNSREYLCKEKSLTNISTVVKNNIIRLLPKGKSAYIELYAPDQISDWIKIINCFKITSRAVCSHVAHKEQEQSLFHVCDMDYKPIIDNPFDLKMFFCPLIFGAIVITAILVRGMLY